MKKPAFVKVFLILLMAALPLALYLYKAEPDFLLGFFYGRIYPDRIGAVPEVILNETPVSFDLDLAGSAWSIQKKNGQWFTVPKEPFRVSGYETKPAAITSHEDKLAVGADKEPDRASLRIIKTESGQVVLEGPVVLSSLPLPELNGNYTYELTMEWTREESPYQGKYVLKIPAAVDLPAKFVFSAQRVAQGQLLEVMVYNAGKPEEIFFEQSVCDNFQWYQQDGFLRGYLPTNYSVKPGVYPIKYGSKRNGTEYTQEIVIAAYNYHIQHLSIDPQTEQETRNEAAYAEYDKYFTPVRYQSAAARYYTESFIMPAGGRLSTEFGETRYVNGSPTSYRHSGLDIAAPAGAGVKAANRGKVVLARHLILTGNTVVIDHGEGLFSVYFHMLNLSVAAGDMAERGQKIGEVGSTGFSSGPHLHFVISYYAMNLEPGYFLVGQPITYDNYREFIE